MAEHFKIGMQGATLGAGQRIGEQGEADDHTHQRQKKEALVYNGLPNARGGWRKFLGALAGHKGHILKAGILNNRYSENE